MVQILVAGDQKWKAILQQYYRGTGGLLGLRLYIQSQGFSALEGEKVH